jgi:hypothetical protein
VSFRNLAQLPTPRPSPSVSAGRDWRPSKATVSTFHIHTKANRPIDISNVRVLTLEQFILRTINLPVHRRRGQEIQILYDPLTDSERKVLVASILGRREMREHAVHLAILAAVDPLTVCGDDS